MPFISLHLAPPAPYKNMIETWDLLETLLTYHSMIPEHWTAYCYASILHCSCLVVFLETKTIVTTWVCNKNCCRLKIGWNWKLSLNWYNFCLKGKIIFVLRLHWKRGQNIIWSIQKVARSSLLLQHIRNIYFRNNHV